MNVKIFRCGRHTTTKRPRMSSTYWIPERYNRIIIHLEKLKTVVFYILMWLKSIT